MEYIVSVDFIVEADNEDEAKMIVIEMARSEAAVVATYNICAD